MDVCVHLPISEKHKPLAHLSFDCEKRYDSDGVEDNNIIL